MPFTDPYKPQDQIEQVRKLGRLAQIVGRIAEMETVRAEIVAHMAAPVSATEQPAAEMNGSEPPGEE